MAGSWLVGALRVTLGLDSAAFEDGIGLAQKRMKGFEKSFASIGGQLSKAGALMTVGITAPFAALVGSAIPAARESAQALAQVNAALKSMGPVAGYTSAQLQDMAGKLQSMSLFDDDDILKSVTANMLTFGKITGDEFARAQVAVVNLSARLGQDLQSSAIQVGKALNDPIKGVTALQRVGVSFSAQQREQIKAMVEAGNVAEAQRMILSELEKQYGGAAKAARDATPDAAMQEQWRTLQENIGAVALKVLPPLLNAVTRVMEGFNALGPSVQTFIVGAGAVAAVLGPVITVIGGLITATGAMLPAFAAVSAALATLAAVVTGTVIPAIGAMIVALSPILIPLAAVAAAVGVAYLAWKNWDKIWPILKGVATAVANLHAQLQLYLIDKLNAVWQWVWQKIQWVGDKFKWLWDVVVGHSYVPDMVDAIGRHMARLQGNMVSVAESATARTAKAFKDMDEKIRPIMERLFPEQAALEQFRDDLSALQASGDPRKDEAIRRLYAQDGRGAMTGAAGSFGAVASGSAAAGRGLADSAKMGASAVVDALERRRRDLVNFWGSTLEGGLRAGLDGNFKNWFSNWWKDQLVRSMNGVISTLANKLGGGGGMFDTIGSLIGLGSAAKATKGLGNLGKSLGSSLPKLAGGGAMKIGGLGGIDRNLLSINGVARAMVGSDEWLHVTPANDRSPAPPIRFIVTAEEGALFRPVIRAESGAVAGATFAEGTRVAGKRASRRLA